MAHRGDRARTAPPAGRPSCPLRRPRLELDAILKGTFLGETMTDGANYAVISADCHGGADIRAYRPYLEARYLDDFDAWAATFENPFDDIAGEGASRNWDSTRRLREMEADGVVAEVLFPNTVPPFFPKASLVQQPPGAGTGDLERRWAGLRAHNRWLADFCADAPGRRAGIAQIMLHDVEGSVAEIRWAAEHGLTGGVLLPGAPPGSGVPPLYAPDYEPIWTVCEEVGLPINHHSGSAAPDFGDYPAAAAMFLLEVTWWAHRTLWHLLFSGVLERHPDAAVRVHRAGHRLAARGAHPARLLPRPPRRHRRRGRLAGGEVRRHAAGALAEAVGVLRPPVPRGGQLHPPARGRAARAGRRRSHHVGQRLPPPRGLLAVLEGTPAHGVRRRSRT